MPEDKINDPPFLPRASVCVHGCSTFITYFLSNQTRRMSPGDFTLTRGFWKRGAKKVRNRAWKYYTRSVPMFLKEIDGNRHFRRQCRKSLVCFGIILHRTGEMGSWINAGQLQKLVTPVATTSWRFTVAICRQPKTQRTEPACYRYSAPIVGCQLMSIDVNLCQLMSIDVNCGMQTDFTRSS